MDTNINDDFRAPPTHDLFHHGQIHEVGEQGAFLRRRHFRRQFRQRLLLGGLGHFRRRLLLSQVGDGFL